MAWELQPAAEETQGIHSTGARTWVGGPITIYNIISIGVATLVAALTPEIRETRKREK